MYIPVWLIIYTIVFGTGVWYGKLILTDNLSSFDKTLALFCTLASLVFVLIIIAFLLGYPPMVLIFC